MKLYRYDKSMNPSNADDAYNQYINTKIRFEEVLNIFTYLMRQR